MLLKNILINKIISILCISILLTSLISLFTVNNTKAATIDDELKEFKDYPGYVELLKKLKEAHPNWTFEILKTGLKWPEVIIAESTGYHGRNVVPKSWGSAYKCVCGKVVDASWTCASTATVSYYMDPRNSLNEDYIFQFEKLTLGEVSKEELEQLQKGVETILEDCDYMQGKIKYYDSNGKEQTIDKTYSQVIIEAAQQYNVTPYHLASRIRQEQGTGSGSEMIKGKYKGYEGLYNYFNVGAFGSTTKKIMESGLTNARDYGWTDPEKAIKGGASVISNGYTSQGQDTLYLEKFDVDKTNGLYSHQYMTNVSASKTEGEKIREAYRNVGMITKDSKMIFKIPVYEDMPEMQAQIPGTEQMVTEDVKINADKVEVKAGKGTEFTTVATLNKDEKILRIELDNNKDSKGKAWDKVVLKDGTKGYVIRDYLTKFNIEKPLNEEYVVTTYTNFRNGPGTTSTTILKLLSPGQIVTVIEKDKYKNVDKEDWYRVKTADGIYGYVGTGYIAQYNPNTSTVDKVKVVCTDGLNIRKEPSSNKSVQILKTVPENTILTRTEKDVKSSDTKYIWDKVTTNGGIVGYVARQDPETKKAWIEPVDENNPSTEEPKEEPKVEGNGFKIINNNLVCQPNITVENIKSVAKETTIKDGNTTKTTGNLATGWKITVGEKTYSIVVKGDVNGDGKVTTVDAARVLKNAASKYELKDVFLTAADVNNDNKVTTVDAARVLKAAAGKYSISI